MTETFLVAKDAAPGLPDLDKWLLDSEIQPVHQAYNTSKNKILNSYTRR